MNLENLTTFSHACNVVACSSSHACNAVARMSSVSSPQMTMLSRGEGQWGLGVGGGGGRLNLSAHLCAAAPAATTHAVWISCSTLLNCLLV
jgi:hypothetical protein